MVIENFNSSANFFQIDKKDAVNLIEIYYDKIEDLEDFLAIKQHELGKKDFAEKKDVNDVFSRLLK